MTAEPPRVRPRLHRGALLSLASAAVIGLIAVVRVLSENEHHLFDGTPLAWIQQVPAGASLWSRVQVQWFKVLYFPAVAAFLYVVLGGAVWLGAPASSTGVEVRDGALHFPRRLTVRVAVVCFLGSVGMEVLKAYGRSNLVPLAGESVPLNHVAHLVSCVIGAGYMHLLTFGRLRDVADGA